MAALIAALMISTWICTSQAKPPVVPVPQPEPYPNGQLAEDVRALSESVSSLTQCVDGLTAATDSISQQLVSVTDRVEVLETPSVVEQPAPQCVCECECPTIDEVRTVVREELDKTAALCKPPAKAPQPVAPTPAPKPVASVPVTSDPIVEFVCDPVTNTCRPIQQSQPVQQMRPVQTRGGLLRGLFRPAGR